MKLKALLIAISLFFANAAVASDHCSWYIEDRGWCTPYFPTSDPYPSKKNNSVENLIQIIKPLNISAAFDIAVKLA